MKKRARNLTQRDVPLIRDMLKINPPRKVAEILDRDYRNFRVFCHRQGLIARRFRIKGDHQSMGLAGEIFEQAGKCKLTAKYISQQLLVDTQRVYRWRRGEASPPLYEAELIARMCGYKLALVPLDG